LTTIPSWIVSELRLVDYALRSTVFLNQEGGSLMLRYALIFAILALIAGVLGFVGLEGTFAYIARVLLFVFVVLFVLSVILGRRFAEPIA
jgi:uncharacterized membrane protein YtjA (UPF0391 family)